MESYRQLTILLEYSCIFLMGWKGWDRGGVGRGTSIMENNGGAGGSHKPMTVPVKCV